MSTIRSSNQTRQPTPSSSDTTSGSNLFSTSDSTTKGLDVILPVIVTVLLLGSAVAFLIYESNRAKPQNQDGPQEEIICVLCTEETAKFEYRMVLRLGCPTANFDMQHSFLDIELLGRGDERLGDPVRFDCSRLLNPYCGEMHILIGSREELKEISGIQARADNLNGNSRGKIFLFEYELQDLADDIPEESVLEVRRFNSYITSRQTIFRGTPWTGEDPDDAANCNLEMPAVEWTRLELVVIATFLVIAVGCVIIIIESFSLYPSGINTKHAFFTQTLMDAVYGTLLGLVLLGVVAGTYKYYIKRNLIKSGYSICRQDLEYWQQVIKWLTIFVLVLSFALGGTTIYFSTQIAFAKSACWLGATTVTAIVVLGTWRFCNRCKYLRTWLGEGNNRKARGEPASGKSTKSKKGKPEAARTKGIEDASSSHRPTTSNPHKQAFRRDSEANMPCKNRTQLFLLSSKSRRVSIKNQETHSKGPARIQKVTSVSTGPKHCNVKDNKKTQVRKKAKKGGGKLVAWKKRKDKVKSTTKKKKGNSKSNKAYTVKADKRGRTRRLSLRLKKTQKKSRTSKKKQSGRFKKKAKTSSKKSKNQRTKKSNKLSRRTRRGKSQSYVSKRGGGAVSTKSQKSTSKKIK